MLIPTRQGRFRLPARPLVISTAVVTLLAVASYPAPRFAGGRHRLDPLQVLAPQNGVTTTARLSPIIGVLPLPNLTELNAKTYRTDTVKLPIQNLGDATLDYQIAVASDNGGQAHLSVNGALSFSGQIGAGSPPDFVAVTYDGIGLPDPSEWNWRLELTSNDPSNDPGAGGSAIDIVLNVFVADTWFTCTEDTISTGLHRLSVSSCLRLGDMGAGGGLWTYASGREWLYSASPILAWMDGDPPRVYRDIYWMSLADRSRDSNRAFRAQSAVQVTRDTTMSVGNQTLTADVARGTATSTDSIFQLDWEVRAYKDQFLANGVVMAYSVTNRTANTYSGLTLGAVADFDVDSMSTANDGIASGYQYIGAQGGWRDAGGLFHPQFNYAFLSFIPLDSNCQGLAVGGQVLDLVDYVYPQESFNDDSLYQILQRTSGWDATIQRADTPSDVGIVLVDRRDATLGPGDTLRFAFGIGLNEESFRTFTRNRALRGSMNPACGLCPIEVTGDLNGSLTITTADVIILVNYVFKGLDGLEPCDAAGDTNCNGAVTSADIILLVSHIFKGGTLPCDGCTSKLASQC